MTRKALFVAAVAGTLLVAAACRRAEQAPAAEPAPSPAVEAAMPAVPEGTPSPDPLAGRLKGKVLETMDAGGYTYVRVHPDSGEEIWAAGPLTPIAVGDVVLVETTMPMPGFESASLERRFDVVYFCGSLPVVSGGGAGGPAAAPASAPTPAEAMTQAHAKPTPPVATDVPLTGITKAERGFTVDEITAQAASLSGQDVAVRGRVVKFTSRVMGTNWLHVRDGSGEGGNADLTVTTQDSAAVGDLVLVRGKLATNQDFGSGYSYAVMVQDATLEPQSAPSN